MKILPERVTMSSWVRPLLANICVILLTSPKGGGRFWSASEAEEVIPSLLPDGTAYVMPPLWHILKQKKGIIETTERKGEHVSAYFVIQGKCRLTALLFLMKMFSVWTIQLTFYKSIFIYIYIYIISWT